jgi:hypothetical protein
LCVALEEFMRISRLLCVCFATAGLLGESTPASAQGADTPQAIRQEIDRLRSDFEELRKQYGDRLSALEARLGTLPQEPAAQGAPQAAPPQAPAGTQTAEVPPGAAGAGGPSGSLPIYGAAAAASKIFNPDMAVIGDFLGGSGKNDINPNPALEMHESEASFQAIVDPYARADFFVSFGESGVELEEGFMTFPAAPGGVLLKVGKLRGAFGKVNTLHNHILPWTDRPLVTTNLVGGEDGIDDAGISVARLLPNPWIFLEAIGEIYRGDSSDVFSSHKRGDLTYVGHLRGYHDLTENANVDLGASYARGHNDSGVVRNTDVGRFITQLFGADATVRWRPLQRSIYHSFLGRSEVVWSRREQPLPFRPGNRRPTLVGATERALGYYVSGDYQFARRWFAGARFDWSERADAASVHDSGHSLLLTYWPSEFSQIRGQYRRTSYAEDSTANELLFQFQFSIGAHGAHPF